MSTLIREWHPEDEQFWQRTGKVVARRNLIWSIVAEHVGFSIWMLWSAVAPRLPAAGFDYSTDQLFLLVAIPGLVGALIRLPYTVAVPRFGGRNWTIVSALLLLVPTLLMAVLVQRPQTPFWLMVVAAATAGLGGGNFASSMANISFFFPDAKKGLALGLNAAGGNLGVSTVQLVVPLVVGAGAVGAAQLPARLQLENAALMWLPLIALAALGATFFMNNLGCARSSLKDQLVVTRSKHTWIIAALYIGSFGSFIGYSAAFPLLLRSQFPAVGVELAFLGPLIGSLSRPLGGYLADRLGGARITFWSFVAMGLASLGAVRFLALHSFTGFVAMFFALFVLTGLGNGSTFRMIPVIFREQNLRAVAEGGEAARGTALAAARREAAAVLGLSSAVGALGGFFIPRSLGASIRASGTVAPALACFVLFYVGCVALTWYCYMRPDFMVDRAQAPARLAT